MAEPQLIDRRKLFEQVAAHLERDILSGKLRPGESLPPERDLQAMFGVGRPAIREALITLQRGG
jgi:GntR family transcriptional repressor for pyruvate dehydrogenase complex